MAAHAVPEPIHIDGSMLEGGGQILRNATALAAITGSAISITKIRAGRAKPGLSPQHLTGLQLLERISHGHLTGGAVRSEAITFVPGRLEGGAHEADTRTAGSCTLMLQQALPCLLFAPPPPPIDARPAADPDAAGDAGQDAAAPSVLVLRGGTDAAMAPPVGYLQHVLAPMLRRLMGVGLEVDLLRRGFYPRGGGAVRVTASSLPSGASLPSWDLTHRGQVERVTVRAFGAGRVGPGVAQRMADAAVLELRGSLPGEVAFEVQVVAREPEEHAVGDGCGVLLVAETSSGCLLGASGAGERGVSAEAVGAVAAGSLLDALRSGACVDEWLQDQLIIFMALAKGTSRMRCAEPTLHTRTAMVVAEALLPGVKFTVRPAPAPPDGAGVAAAATKVVECIGAGVQRAAL